MPILRSVWRWAGAYRQTERNIGIDAWRIQTEIVQLLGDVRYWIEHESFGRDEIAARFHHKLVWIHCFPNGNGRHARLATDLLLVSLGLPRFTWGRANLVNAGDTRALGAAQPNRSELPARRCQSPPSRHWRR